MAVPVPPTVSTPTASVVFLLQLDQSAWIRAHAAGNASSFMRRLIAQLMEDERREVERLALAHCRKQRQESSDPAAEPSPVRSLTT